jgi:hypothetical protein
MCNCCCHFLLSNTRVAASSLASHIAVPFLNGGQTCQPYSDFSSGCTDLYLFYAACFAAVVIPLTCMDLTEQTPLQIALACLRFVAVAVMVATSASAIWYAKFGEKQCHSVFIQFLNVDLCLGFHACIDGNIGVECSCVDPVFLFSCRRAHPAR